MVVLLGGVVDAGDLHDWQNTYRVLKMGYLCVIVFEMLQVVVELFLDIV